MSFKRVQIHNEDIKKLLYVKEQDMLVSCSLDGKMKRINVQNMLESEEIVAMKCLVGVVECADGLVIAAQDGVILHMTYEGGARQLKVKCAARPSAIACSGNQLLLGDWEGNLYMYNLATDAVSTHSFGKFRYEDRVVANGIYALCLQGDTILAGLSSGDIAVGDGRNFRLCSLHKKAVRSIQAIDKQNLVSCGNDGRVVVFNLQKDLWKEVQSFYQNNEFLFAIHVFQTGKLSGDGKEQTYIALGGSGPTIEIVNLECMEDRIYLPIIGDVWTITTIENQDGLKMYIGGQAGLITEYCMEKTIQNGYISDFKPQNIKIPLENEYLFLDLKLKQDSFTGGSNKLLPMQELQAKYNYSSLDDIKNKLNNLPRLFVCLYNNIPSLVSFQRNTLMLIAEIESPNQQEKQLNPKDGKYYDESLVVEIEGSKTTRLYLNKNENPQVIALRFLNENGLPTDFDTKKQILDYIEKSVKVTNLESQYTIDSNTLFKVISGQVSKAGTGQQDQNLDNNKALNKILDNLDLNLQTVIATQPNQTSQTIAEKAFGIISPQFEECELTDVCQLFDFSMEQMQNVFTVTEQNRKAFLVVMCYAIQTGENPANDVSEDFIKYLVNILITSEMEADITFTCRLLCLLIQQSKYIPIIDNEIQKNGTQVILKIANVNTNDTYAFLAWVGRSGIRKYLGDDAEMVANIIYQNMLQ